MSDIEISLPDGSKRPVPAGTRAIDIAKSISPRLADAAIVAKVNGELVDLTRPIEQDASVQILTTKDPEALEVYRHSTAHLLAAAVLELYPDTKLGIGPPIENGFYYDFDRAVPFTPEDLEKIEAKMWEIQKRHLPYERIYTRKEEGLQKYGDAWMKCELITERAGEIFSEYTLGPHFIDFCRGPHVPDTSKLKAFKLLSIAGAYWKGNEKNKQLQRIYGTAFFTPKDLQEYLDRLEDAKRRDHRRLGKELELFTVNEMVGAGLPLWLPKGATIRRLLEDYILERERALGYQHVYTPDLAKVDLYEKSGHWAHYHEDMFPPMDLETEKMVLRPMNCPHHILIFDSKQRSYRDLPVKIAELGTMYRYERSGALSGLSRVRCMTLNDAHIFCMPDQIKEEFSNVMRLVEATYKDLGITKYRYRLSLRDKENKEKYVDNDAMWEMGEQMLREAMTALNLPFVEAKGEAAFYGPKLDIQLADVMGHEEDVFHHPGGLPSTQPVRTEICGRRRQGTPPGDDPPRHRQHHGAYDLLPDRALRGCVPAVARSGAGDRTADHRPPGRIHPRRAEAIGSGRNSRHHRRTQREGQLQDPRSPASEDSLHAGGG